jgi:hypothetical protein
MECADLFGSSRSKVGDGAKISAEVETLTFIMDGYEAKPTLF